MWKQLKGVFGKKEAEVPKEILDAKAQATAKKEPFVEVISVNFDKENPSDGYFELEWNETCRASQSRLLQVITRRDC